MSVTVLDTHAKVSLPGGRPCVELARFFVSNFHCRGEVADLISVMSVTFVRIPGRAGFMFRLQNAVPSGPCGGKKAVPSVHARATALARCASPRPKEKFSPGAS